MDNLAKYISVKRRYSRSINLERDLLEADSVFGYVPTAKAAETIERILTSLVTPRSTSAWTITGVYGTGKSSLAHVLSALCGPRKERIYINARNIISSSNRFKLNVSKLLCHIPSNGLLRAIVTAQREPIANTIIKALSFGITNYPSVGRKPNVYSEIESLNKIVLEGGKVCNSDVLACLKSLASRTHVLLIIDELGKNLEYLASNQLHDDLYLLQQIAELPSGPKDPRVFFMGLLHQSFSEYSNYLTIAQRNEWGKIQGRFEDISFVDSSSEMFQLIGHTLNHSKLGRRHSLVNSWAKKWVSCLSQDKYIDSKVLTQKNVSSLYPLHPISSIVLPMLCNRYAQNDRSLFSFLSSSEPHSLTSFLHSTYFSRNLPNLKLDRLYDYFVESAGLSSTLRVQHQRWIEIHGRISDAIGLDHDSLSALKAIGLLNLVSLSGSLRATTKTVKLAMSDNPFCKEEEERWNKAIDLLKQKSFVTWRESLDELRVWQGSDFDFDKAIAEHITLEKRPICHILTEVCPPMPLIVQRHSYETGNLRFFDRRYFDCIEDFLELKSIRIDGDGLICNVLSNKVGDLDLPNNLENGKPIVFVFSSVDTDEIKKACIEYTALKKIQLCSPELQTDSVARREVRYRLIHTKHILDNLLSNAFYFRKNEHVCYFHQKEKIKTQKGFNSRISHLCDSVYNKSYNLKNEILNRNLLTAQGAKARRLLISAMVNHSDKERLNIHGNGPEFSMYSSLLKKTGLHTEKDGHWFLSRPHNRSGLVQIWNAIDEFCKSADKNPKCLTDLYHTLTLPPFGAKAGVIPVLFAAYLLQHLDDMALYQNGTFVPNLDEAVFELVLKRPELFFIKYFELTGINGQILAEVEKVVGHKPGQKSHGQSLLNIVKPLYSFIINQPDYTKRTSNISTLAGNVRNVLLSAREPDVLIFRDLPNACGFDLTSMCSEMTKEDAKKFRSSLVEALRNINVTYSRLLDKCKELLIEVFAYVGDNHNFCSYLKIRVQNLGDCAEPVLKSFINAVKENYSNEYDWIESIAFVVHDKPPKFWDDVDFIHFENNLISVVNRFCSLEALRSCMNDSPGVDFDARRLTITRPDGDGIDEIVWISKNIQTNVNDYVKHHILHDYPVKNNKQFLQAVLCTLSEHLFHLDSKGTGGSITTKGISSDVKKG